jgi:hypothetical protein
MSDTACSQDRNAKLAFHDHEQRTLSSLQKKREREAKKSTVLAAVNLLPVLELVATEIK